MPLVPDSVRSRVPLQVRHRVAKARLRVRVPTGRWRRLPDALVIGGQRCGTSSLYRYLGAHPGASPSSRKEVEYFSRYVARGEDWYRAHFAWSRDRRLGFEATPDYLFHPLAAERAGALLPDARLVVLLRDPVVRAWSHHQHMTRLGYETLSFDDALDAEESRCSPDLETLAVDPGHDAKALLRYSYVTRGRYADQLRIWFAHYPPDRVLVVRSEDLFTDTSACFARIVSFLGLEPWQPTRFRNYSTAVPPLETSTAERLRKVFDEPNADLEALLERPFSWVNGG